MTAFEHLSANAPRRPTTGPAIGGTEMAVQGSRIVRSMRVVTLVACVLVLVMPAQSATTCHPLLILIEGGFGSSDGDSMEGLYKILSDDLDTISIVLLDNEYFANGLTVDGRDFDFKNIPKWLKEAGFWPVVVVGHSLGGASAYFLAKSTPTKLLVTLDAVSSPDEKPHPGAGVRWVNVYAKNAHPLVQIITFFYLGDSLGVDWEHEGNADLNVPVRWTSHSDVSKMFFRAKDEIVDALVSCPSRPRGVNEQTGIRDFLLFCKDDGINCHFSDNVSF